MQGVIAPKATMVIRDSGGASAATLQAQVASMRDDPRVVPALSECDTPGGDVFGISGPVATIAKLAGVKHRVDFYRSDGQRRPLDRRRR